MVSALGAELILDAGVKPAHRILQRLAADLRGAPRKVDANPV
jgi:hypothetical protein